MSWPPVSEPQSGDSGHPEEDWADYNSVASSRPAQEGRGREGWGFEEDASGVEARSSMGRNGGADGSAVAGFAMTCAAPLAEFILDGDGSPQPHVSSGSSSKGLAETSTMSLDGSGRSAGPGSGRLGAGTGGDLTSLSQVGFGPSSLAVNICLLVGTPSLQSLFIMLPQL